MSNVLEEMKTRRSIRKFKPDAIPQEILDQIIEAGTYAANGRGAQNVIIIQVTNKEKRDEIAKKNAEIMGSEGDPFYGAPAMLIVLGKKDWPTHVYDGSLVMGNLMLAAHDLGIGSCWIHRAKEEFESSWGRELLASLGIEDEYEGNRTLCARLCGRGLSGCYSKKRKPRILYQIGRNCHERRVSRLL